MKTTHLDSQVKDHARWSAEHGHWQKDLEIWSEENEKVLDSCSKLGVLIKRFETLANEHLRDFRLHEEEVRLHARELESGKPRSKHPGDALHQRGGSSHEIEKEAHEQIREIRSQIRREAEKLASFYRSSKRKGAQGDLRLPSESAHL